jgi:hypothetical protein
LDIRLATSSGRVRAAVDRGLIKPDHTLQLGERVYYFFEEDRVEEIRERLGLPAVDEETIRDLFLRWPQ